MSDAPGRPSDGDGEADEMLRTAVSLANIPTLLMILVQMTGDRRWLDDPYRPVPNRGLGDNDTGGLPPEIQAEIRGSALRAIRAWRDGEALRIPEPSRQLLVDMLSVSVGEPVPLEYAEMINHELTLNSGVDRGKKNDERESAVVVPEGFRAVIIGAGASGLLAAYRLQEAGIPYTIIERNAEIGGVWYENRYPGAGVDTPSHIYSYSFAKNDWSRYFASQEEIRRYFNKVADDFDIRSNIRFGLEVVEAKFDESTAEWVLTLKNAEGDTEAIRSNLLFSAVGAFNKPRWPKIKGLDSFAGPTPHTARWPDGLDLSGKRVAVIGNGASAMQVVPAIASTVEHLTVFQHSPQWAAPFEQFQKKIPDPVRWLLQEVPLYHAWYRVRLGWIFNDRIYESLQKDPEWEHPDRSINAVNDAHRRYFTRYIETELGDRQDLLEKVLPTYPPFGKRMLLDNGWFRTMARDNVDLVTDHISEIREDRIVAEDGSEHEVDAIVIATGFDVLRFLAPMKLVGRNGVTLDDVWKEDDARAYFGTAVPGFPNFFCLYGPNTQFGHGGSLIFMLELQMDYVMNMIRQMLEKGVNSIECRQDVHDEFNARVDAAHNNMVWTHPGMDTYYRNSAGRVIVNNPFKIVDYWHFVHDADLEDYQYDGSSGAERDHNDTASASAGRGL